MSGSLSIGIQKDISLESVSFKLLIEAYQNALFEDSYSLDWKENQFTVHLLSFMKKSLLRKKHQLTIDTEIELIDYEELPVENNDPDKAPRIDIRIVSWQFQTGEELKYYFEAKNLSQNSWFKSKKTRVDATSLQKRYIETGVENFRISRYCDGSLVGYILDGKTDLILDKLNDILLEYTNTVEKITKTKKDYCYESKHLTPSKEEMTIKHVFLNFVIKKD